MLIPFSYTSTRRLSQQEGNVTIIKHLLSTDTLTCRTPSIFSPSVTVVIVHCIITGKALKTVWKWSGFKSMKI